MPSFFKKRVYDEFKISKILSAVMLIVIQYAENRKLISEYNSWYFKRIYIGACKDNREFNEVILNIKICSNVHYYFNGRCVKRFQCLE